MFAQDRQAMGCNTSLGNYDHRIFGCAIIITDILYQGDLEGKLFDASFNGKLFDNFQAAE
jgi:hypothetical protein